MKRYISLIVFVFFLCVHVFANSPSATLKKMSSLKEKTEKEKIDETEKLLEEKNMDLLVSPQLAMSTRDYMVTAGDIYTLAYAVGTNPVTYTIPVDSSYKIRVSNMAVIDAKGKSFLQIKKQVEDIVTRNFPMSGVQFVLTQPAIFKVNIIGEVEKTVVKQCWSLTNLSVAIEGTLTDYSSNRNVIVTSADGTKKEYDLFKAERFGDFSQNPYVRPGDTITIQKTDRKVTVEGAVKRPGTYDLLKGENLSSLIDYYADGLAPLADMTRIELYRSISEQNPSGEIIYLTKEQLTNNDFELSNYDLINIPSYKDLKSVMFIEGAIGSVSSEEEETSSVAETNKIVVQFDVGENYATLIRKYRDSFAFQADKKNAYIIRKDEIIPIDVDKILYDQSFYSEHLVESNDTLIVPFKQYFITVAGAVKNPGRYPYLPDRNYMYYIGLAGGFDKLKNKGDKIDIVNRDGLKLDISDVIEPETTITAKTNSFTYWFNQYSPFISTILTLITTSITLYNVTK